ncbi:hypothetical protein RDI58_006926 [Solanum bulbocastanum]|uniref:Uncharacterized protein n=1 Tax=Solanum bulbocastanum TaxID=147425 RepID=A0AAN8TRV0_SOLBU
MDTWRAYQEE